MAAEVTVVIPNYNGKKYLPACLDALRVQDFSDLKVIVVDNGSADGSVDLIREGYPEVELICLPRNQGFCGAVNVGIRAARTPFVLWRLC